MNTQHAVNAIPAITRQYKGIEITYNVATNPWDFELRGRQRHAASLVLATEAIEKPVAVTKESTFKRVECWKSSGHRSDFVRVEVTSIAGRQYGSQQVWITYKETTNYRKVGEREKCSVTELYPVNARNEKLIVEIQAADRAVEQFNSQRDNLKGRMQKCLAPEDEKELPTEGNGATV